jgi:hypothetical protein
MGWMRVIAVLLFLGVGARATPHTATCTGSQFFTTEWPQLVKLEPRLQAFINDVAKRGAPVGPNGVIARNCHVDTFIDDQGRLLSLEKGVVFDVDWSLDGGHSLFHAGFKVKYRIKPPDPNRPQTDVISVTGIAFCGTKDACDYLSIPFFSNS